MKNDVLVPKPCLLPEPRALATDCIRCKSYFSDLLLIIKKLLSLPKTASSRKESALTSLLLFRKKMTLMGIYVCIVIFIQYYIIAQPSTHYLPITDLAVISSYITISKFVLMPMQGDHVLYLITNPRPAVLHLSMNHVLNISNEPSSPPNLISQKLLVRV